MSYPTRHQATPPRLYQPCSPVDQKMPYLSVRRLLRRGHFWFLLMGITCLSACAASDAASPGQSPGQQAGNKAPVPVAVAMVNQKTVPIQIRATGTAQAFSTVSVKSQVEGQLMSVFFKEGQDVRKGDRLFQIDPRSLQAALMQAEATRAKDLAQVKQTQANVNKALAQVEQARATLAKDQAQARNANAQAQRYGKLYKQGAISQEVTDQYQTSAESNRATVIADQNAIADALAAVEAAKADVQNAQAAVAADEAAIANAKVQLSYSSIYSPIDGRTSSLQVNQGNLVQANSTTPLTVISQVQPIYVTFSIPQRLLPEVRQYSANNKLEVDALPANGSGAPVRGRLTFIDSGVNAQTGTIQLKGTFANAEKRLAPGEFVNVVLKLTQKPNAITVPAQTIQNGQQGQFVYVVKPDKTVEARSVRVGDTVGSEIIIQDGLKPGEQVVVDGQFNLAPGAKVQIKPGVDSQSGAGAKPGAESGQSQTAN